MFFREDIVLKAINELGSFHPFFGTTFLACKKGQLPVGEAISFQIAELEGKILQEFYRPDLNSKHYFQPFHTSSSSSRWLSPKYPSSGLQATRTKGLLADAFIHEYNSDLWGWSSTYLDVLQKKLVRDRSGKVPMFWLAIWLFRNHNWGKKTGPKDLIKKLVDEFKFSSQEIDKLFNDNIPILSESIFKKKPFDDKLLLPTIGVAPDAPPEHGGTLKILLLHDVGPAQQIEFLPAERLSLITGDNGLGKTFLLECSWWSLTGEWAGNPALPSMLSREKPASISFSISHENSQENLPAAKPIKILYNAQTQSWPSPKGRPTIPGLIVYARVDGSYAIWDPARQENGAFGQKNNFLVFGRDDILDGVPGRIEGLIRDWVKWQTSKDQTTFSMFSEVLKVLSPPDMAPLVPGEPVRIPRDARDIPTLLHNYGIVPFTNESAGIKRILTVAYLLVWAWREHQVLSSMKNREPERKMVILIDEIEAHLHPRWQRTILPALLRVARVLGEEIEPQMIVATHSPLILASIENTFIEGVDKLFHLSLRDNMDIKFEDIAFQKHGTIDAWLKSDIFELKQARSLEAESILEQAKKILADNDSSKETIKNIFHRLCEVLPNEDPFWPRWLHFMEMKGVLV